MVYFEIRTTWDGNLIERAINHVSLIQCSIFNLVFFRIVNFVAKAKLKESYTTISWKPQCPPYVPMASKLNLFIKNHFVFPNFLIF